MKIRSFITYLHVLALDAPLIGLAWQQYFAQSYGIDAALSKQGLILVTALWLGYMADRLFDVRNKEPEHLQNKRHQFAHAYRHQLWLIWGIILVISIAYSLSSLNSEKIVACLALFFAILLYNLVNQCLWQENFPKEVCVAILFSSACLVLLDAPFQWHDFLNLSLVIFLNCILLSKKEQLADKRIGFSSMAQALNSLTITGLILGSTVYFALGIANWWNPFFVLAVSLLTLQVLSLKSLRLSDASYRFIVESLYCTIPLFFLL